VYWLFCHSTFSGTTQSAQTTIGDSEWTYQQSIVHSLNELLIVTPELDDYPRREIVSTAIDTYICENLDNNASEFGRQIGVSKRTATELRRGTQLPQLPTLLNICALLDTTPLALLTQKTGDTLQAAKLQIAPLNYEKQSPRAFDEDYARGVLEAVLEDNSYPPPSMRKMAKELEFDASFLHNHFPDLCGKISTRYLQYRVERKATRIANLCQQVRQKVFDLHKHGKRPSENRLSRIFHKALRTVPEAYETYCQAMRELGYHLPAE
jgi:transcriptional regulator with XRE-family HTH domain